MIASESALKSFKTNFPHLLVSNKSIKQRLFWFFNHAKEIPVNCSKTNLQRFVYGDVEFRVRKTVIVAVRKYVAPPPPRPVCTYNISKHSLERFEERHPNLVGTNGLQSMEDLLMSSIEYRGFLNDTLRVTNMIAKYGDLPMIRINGKVTFVIRNNLVLTTLTNF